MPGNRCNFRVFFLIFLFSIYPNPNPKPSPTPKPNHKPNPKPNHKPNPKPNHKPNPKPNPIIINYGLKDRYIAIYTKHTISNSISYLNLY